MKIISGSKRRHYVTRVGTFLIMIALITGIPSSCAVGPDDTNPSRNLEIQTWYDLDAVRDNLAGNHTLMNDLDSTTAGYAELASEIANQGQGWQPIGYFSYNNGNKFTGTLDGQGYKIHDLFINRPNDHAVGLVGVLWQEGVVENIGMVNVTVTGDYNVGGLVGYSQGIVSNSYSSGSVTGGHGIGGLVGRSDDTVNNSYSTADVTGSQWVGGLVGYSQGSTVSNSYSSGSVNGNNYVGGLMGENVGDVSSSYSTGIITGSRYVGGLVGANSYGTVSNSFWDIETSGQYTSAGGTGKNTTEMQDIATFSVGGWNIIPVALNETNPAYIWNIVNNVTYPFLGWQS